MLDTPHAAKASGTTASATKPAELTAKQMFMLFPTPMFTGKLPDVGLCDRIEK